MSRLGVPVDTPTGTPGFRPRPAGIGAWIVCLGEQRAVHGGRVTCPRLVASSSATDRGWPAKVPLPSFGETVDVRLCRACHLLAARSDDRDGDWDCGTPAGAASGGWLRRRDRDR